VTDESIFEQAARVLEGELPDVERAKIMHSPGLRVNGKFFAFARAETIVVKLAAERVTALTKSGEGEPFATGKRVMTEWIVIRPRSVEAAVAYVTEAYTFLSAMRERGKA
jgi:hypothetical protein